MAFLTLEDIFAGVEVIVFPKVYKNVSDKINEDSIVAVWGTLSIREDEKPKIHSDKVEYLDEIEEPKPTLYIRIADGTKEEILEAAKILKKYSGTEPVCFFVNSTKKTILAPKTMWVKKSESLMSELTDQFGAENIRIK